MGKLPISDQGETVGGFIMSLLHWSVRPYASRACMLMIHTATTVLRLHKTAHQKRLSVALGSDVTRWSRQSTGSGEARGSPHDDR